MKNTAPVNVMGAVSPVVRETSRMTSVRWRIPPKPSASTATVTLVSRNAVGAIARGLFELIAHRADRASAALSIDRVRLDAPRIP